MDKKALIKTLFLNAVIYLLVFLLDILKSWHYRDQFESEMEFYSSTFLNVSIIMGLIWINHLLLIRYLFDKKKYLLYGVILFGIVLFVGFYIGYEGGWYKVVAITLFYSYTTGMGMGAFFLRRSLRIKKQINEKEQLQRKMEVNYLKAQVNPHFLFNSLNSIYSLSRKQSTETPDVVMQLSELMRYQLESAKRDSVILKEELAFLENYLLLEEQRLSTRCKIEFTIEGDAIDLQIAPMLLIPFVENAIKHGAHSTNEKSIIDVTISIKNNKFDFFVENSKPSTVFKNQRQGIGLINVKRRLQLLYPKAHTLKIDDTERNYKVFLSINLSNASLKKIK